MKQLEEAERDYTTALKILPRAAQTRCRRAMLRLDLDRLDDALVDANIAIDDDPTLAKGYATRGWLQHIKGNGDAAVQDIQKAIRIDPMDATHHFNLGVVNRKLGRIDTAEREFHRTLDLSPHHFRGMVEFNLAAIAHARGESEKGRQSWSNYRKEFPQRAEEIEKMWGKPTATEK